MKLLKWVCIFLAAVIAGLLLAAGGPLLEILALPNNINVIPPKARIVITENSAVKKEITKIKLSDLETADFELGYEAPNTDNAIVESDMIYKIAFTELPLAPADYYKNKYENAAAGVSGLNKMPVMTAGASVGVIKDRYISIKAENGFMKAPGHFFGSGVCWSTSALGALLDKANAQFKSKYGVDLVVYKSGDRGPHSDKYLTYTNGGYGYTILEISDGVPAQDYRFTINPALKDIPELSDLKIRIVMLNTVTHKTGSHGQAIAGYVLSNKDF